MQRIKVAAGWILAASLLFWLSIDWVAALIVGLGPTARVQPPRPPLLDKRPVYQSTSSNGMYLDLMKLALTGLLYEEDTKAREHRLEGKDWPVHGYTMIGLKRLDNLQVLTEEVIRKGIVGDLIEAGAWKGGATIFMRAILKAHDVKDRKVWVADSFEGVPAPNDTQYPADAGNKLYEQDELAVSVEKVQTNFKRFGLLDDQVRFLKGWFKDSLPNAPIDKLAILRIDADLYESTTDALTHLYPKLVPGGYVIIDDYGAMETCARAVDDYRARHRITEKMDRIDWTGVYWQKSPEPEHR